MPRQRPPRRRAPSCAARIPLDRRKESTGATWADSRGAALRRKAALRSREPLPRPGAARLIANPDGSQMPLTSGMQTAGWTRYRATLPETRRRSSSATPGPALPYLELLSARPTWSSLSQGTGRVTRLGWRDVRARAGVWLHAARAPVRDARCGPVRKVRVVCDQDRDAADRCRTV